jgi:hypothetical protein
VRAFGAGERIVFLPYTRDVFAQTQQWIESHQCTVAIIFGCSSFRVTVGRASRTVRATQRNFPGATFRNDKFVHHHDQAISNWTMLDRDGNAIFVGTSYARFGDDGRLAQMTGFFEPVR